MKLEHKTHSFVSKLGQSDWIKKKDIITVEKIGPAIRADPARPRI